MIGGIGTVGAPSLFGGDSTPLAPGSGAAGEGVASSFAAALSDVAGRAVGSLHQAEHLSVQALQGNADMREVVDAVMSAEQSLQAAVAIRDKIVAAYLEISRMGI